MGKLIGALVGLIFGPLGALIGLVIGALYDMYSRGNNRLFTLFSGGEGLPVMYEGLVAGLAALTIQNGLNKRSVLTVKEIIINQMDTNYREQAMDAYRELVEGAWSDAYLGQVSQKLLFFLDYQHKAHLVINMFQFLDKTGIKNSASINLIQQISMAIGLSIGDFAILYERFHGQDTNYSARNNYFEADKSPYTVLGLDKSASIQEIKKQYRSLSKQFHPDMTQNLPDQDRQKAEVKMREINQAYSRLKELRNFN
jgi:DnaJ like chaperone protein